MKTETILNRMLAIKAKKADLKKEEDKLKKIIDKKLGEEDKLDVGGYRFLRQITARKKFNLESLYSIVGDRDAVNSCLIPENKLVKAMFKTQELSKEKIVELDEKMDIISESKSIKLQKINTIA